jgi:hypothetical protein
MMSGFASRLRPTKYDSFDSWQDDQQICQNQLTGTYTARTLGLLSVHLMEKDLERLLQGLVFGALVVFAHKVAANFQRVEAEVQGRQT